MKRTLIVDLGDPSREAFVGGINLIDPHDAIQYIATGKFYAEPIKPVRPWYTFRDGHHDYEVGAETGRYDLATELVEQAVWQGRLRCALVGPSQHTRDDRLSPSLSALRLEYVDPAEFQWGEFHFGWEDEGYSIQVAKPPPDEDGDELVETLEGFMFFWDEVAQMRTPRSGDDDPMSAPMIEATPVPSALPVSMPLARGRLPAPSRGGGRPTKAPAAHAALTIKLLEATDEEFANFTVESAAMELQALSGAHLDNCRKAARQIVQQVREHRESKS